MKNLFKIFGRLTPLKSVVVELQLLMNLNFVIDVVDSGKIITMTKQMMQGNPNPGFGYHQQPHEFTPWCMGGYSAGFNCRPIEVEDTQDVEKVWNWAEIHIGNASHPFGRDYALEQLKLVFTDPDVAAVIVQKFGSEL